MKWLPSVLLLSLVAGCDGPAADYPRRQPPSGILQDSASLAAGGELFREHCASCHGSGEEGRSPRADFFRPPAPDFRASSYRSLDPAYLYWRIEAGKTVEPYLSRGSVMPAWGPYLDEEQIWQLVAYLRSRGAG